MPATDRNAELFERAQRVIPGGVNSPVRAFRAVGGTPRFVTRAQGAYFWDADGRRYIDYIGSWRPMILGHGHPAVRPARPHPAPAAGSAGGAPPTVKPGTAPGPRRRVRPGPAGPERDGAGRAA